MRGVDAQRTTVRGQPLDVEQLEAFSSERILHRLKGQIRVMLVIDRVELIFPHEIQQMRKFHGDDTSRFQKDLQALHKIVEGGYVRKHVVADEQVGVLALIFQLRSQRCPEESYQRGNSRLLCHASTILSGLDSQHRNVLLSKVLEKVPVVACDFDH